MKLIKKLIFRIYVIAKWLDFEELTIPYKEAEKKFLNTAY